MRKCLSAGFELPTVTSVSAGGCKHANSPTPLVSGMKFESTELTCRLTRDGSSELSRADGIEEEKLQLKNVSAPSRIELEFSNRLNVTPIIQDNPNPSIPVQGIAITLYLEYGNHQPIFGPSAAYLTALSLHDFFWMRMDFIPVDLSSMTIWNDPPSLQIAQILLQEQGVTIFSQFII
jgi:hypothetical protein